ncbi:MAG TPA: hypothetical protein ENK44_07905 [Caldithrix abyssi]|uniref:Uncharacterized protein n=1 Tax=Caldithrix abyssi TaxID=187145 RepID=A0A7V4WVK1_CALAY|nr:hypothetical protein [Caldithrix abyssi]
MYSSGIDWLSVVSFQFLVRISSFVDRCSKFRYFGYWLLAIGYWLLAFYCWLSVLKLKIVRHRRTS